MQFIQPDSTVPLFFAQEAESVSHTVAYVSNATGQQSFTMQQAWADMGCFVYLRELPFDLAGFYTYLTTTLNVLTSNTRILWANSVGQIDITQWQYFYIQANNQTSNSATITNNSAFFYRNYGLKVGIGSVLNFNSGEERFEIVSGSTTSVNFYTDSGTTPVTTPNLSIFCPFYGESNPGWMQFQLTLNATDFTNLNAGVRYFYPDTITIGNIDSLFFPLFNVANGNVNLFGLLNPCKNDGIEDFSLGFINPLLPPAPGQIFESFFMTSLGYNVSLQAQQNSQLAIAVLPSTTTPSPNDLYYLVPQGDFVVSVANSKGVEIKFMPGLSGVEFISMSQDDEVILRFIPGCAAYAANFSNTQPNGESSRLTQQATTSWGYFTGGDLRYFAQPDKSILHVPNLEQGSFLQPVNPPAGHLPVPPADDWNSHCFPLVSLAGLPTTDLTNFQNMEQQILSQERRHRIYTINSAITPVPPAKNSSKVVSATPTGLMVAMDTRMEHWKSLTLGKDNSQNLLQLSNVTGALKAAFQTNNQFIVISDPKVLSHVFQDNKCTISGWNFDMAPANWNSHGTLMIVKYYPGQSLENLVATTGSWQHGSDFNCGNVTPVQTAITSIIQSAITQSANPDGKYFKNFASIVQDPEWNGVLFLNAFVPLNALPAQLEGLAAGINPSLFYAHHVGWSLSPIQTSKSGNLTSSQSAFFGLINYSAPADEAQMQSGGDYAFQVNNLNVEFINSEISFFSSQIQVTLNRMFGEACTSANSNAANSIVLNGTYQDHGGNATYSFQSSNGNNVYNMNSPILSTVTISNAQFVTIQSKNGWGGNSLVHTRFIFTGNICFQTLEEVDLFSYSSLPFQGLWLDMAFNINNPGSRVFQFDVSDISFIPQNQVLHGTQSFCSQFPLKITGLVYNPGSNSSIGNGFLAAAMPDNFSGIDGEFYGLLYDLSLGTMGSLAPKKSFTAQLLLCWTPQKNYNSAGPSQSYPAELKMQLPFASDGKDLLDIEGVIKLGIESIQLFAADGAYTIKLRNFGLHILSLTIPPAGTTDIFLFGDPHSGSNALAWYAAYNKQVSYAQDPYSS